MANEKEYNDYINQLEEALETANQDRSKVARGQVSLFNSVEEVNLVKWQLDLKEDLDKVYHLLRGDRFEEDQDGNQRYVEQPNPELRPFNEFGVQLIMNILSFYLNRNTILSNYDEDTINWKVLDFGNELADLIHNRYEDMMMTLPPTATDEETDYHLADKLKLFPMIVKEIVDSVHSAYLRAYRGMERESLRTARTVTQSEPIGSGRMMGQNISPTQIKKTKWYNPSTW